MSVEGKQPIRRKEQLKAGSGTLDDHISKMKLALYASQY
jgi:hypothetical protein